MSTESPKPDLKLVEEAERAHELSLAEIARQALKESQEQREAARQAEIKRVDELLERISEINNDIRLAVQIVGNAHPADREAVKAKLKERRKAKEDEKEELLNDNGVQLRHIQELILELNNCNRWDQLTDIVEAAHSRGWFLDLPKNDKGNINFRALRFPNFKNKELKNVCAELKEAVIEALKKIAEKSKELKAKKASEQEGFVNRPKLLS